ncbi:MAG: hypothetical protein Q7J82_07035 [Coriobacteriia bacterium]|nr:hypothetical protein [Coriobacteriia bacterium]
MRVAAWSCVLFGAIALAKTLVLLFRGEVSFDPTVLLLLAGIALLFGWIRFRMWIIAYIASIATLAIVGLSLVLARSLDRIVIGGLVIRAWQGALTALIIVVALASAAFWALYSSPRARSDAASH